MSKRFTNGGPACSRRHASASRGHHARSLQVLVAQRLAFEEPDHEDSVFGKEFDDGRADAGRRGTHAVLVLGTAVDGQLVGGGRRRMSEHVRAAGRRHLEVLVGETARERLDPQRLSAPARHPLQQRGVQLCTVAGAHRSGNGAPLRAATMRRSRGGRRSCSSAP